MLSCTLTIEYMRVLARFVFRYGVLCLDACFFVLGAFLRLLVAFDAAAGLPDAIGADLVRVFRSAGLFLFPVPDLLQVPRILCAVPVCICSGSFAAIVLLY